MEAIEANASRRESSVFDQDWSQFPQQLLGFLKQLLVVVGPVVGL
jgi:hypothetical protein